MLQSNECLYLRKISQRNIQLSLILTKLFRIKRDHSVIFFTFYQKTPKSRYLCSRMNDLYKIRQADTERVFEVYCC